MRFTAIIVAAVSVAAAHAAVVSELADKREADPWCLFHGEGCWKRDGMDDVVARCNADDGACSQARRDLGAMHTAARNLLDYLNEE